MIAGFPAFRTVGKRGEPGAVPLYLLLQPLGVGAGGEGHYLQAIRKPVDEVECLLADGAGGTEESDASFHA